jgi:hypothetical protein
MAPKRIRFVPGYTALEAVFLLLALVVLAMTSLAVYQKMKADADVTQTPAAQDANPQEPTFQPTAESDVTPSAKAIR